MDPGGTAMAENVIIMGAAGRDFHNFNVYFRDNTRYNVLAFTAAQIPNIENRQYPPNLAGRLVILERLPKRKEIPDRFLAATHAEIMKSQHHLFDQYYWNGQLENAGKIFCEIGMVNTTLKEKIKFLRCILKHPQILKK